MNVVDLKRLYAGLTEGTMTLKAVQAEAVTVCPDINIHKPRTTKHVAECVLRNNIEQLEAEQSVACLQSPVCVDDKDSHIATTLSNSEHDHKGQRIAYLRVSSVDQNLERQREITESCTKTFEDKCSGSSTKRPALDALRDYVREGDTVVVHSIDRLARDLSDLQALVSEFNAKGVSLHFKKESLVFNAGSQDSMSTLMLQIFGAVAQFERARIKERQREGIAIAKAKGVYKGRKKQYTKEIVEAALEKHNGNKTRAAKELGCNPLTIYRVVGLA